MDSGNREYSNKEITVFWQPSKCIHATSCYRDLIEVFNPRVRPWINIDGASTEKIIKVINSCPTDALTYKWIDPEKNKLASNEKNSKVKQALEYESKLNNEPVRIKVMADGPLVVQGVFTVLNSLGMELKAMSAVSFCRCGSSDKMPYCDGQHRKIGFSSNDY